MQGRGIEGIVALGGGSSLDCAKGANFLQADGGEIADFRGYGKVRGTMLPMIGIPTTAGTGSDAQSYAVLSDARTHVKMACGDPGAAFKIALLDPVLTVSQPAGVTAASGYDALSHAIEAFVTTVAHAAVADLRAGGVPPGPRPARRVLQQPDDLEARGAMLLGSHLAGLAIEHSMLGAGHACANPLTAQFDVVHGIAVSLMLPHVVRWNAEAVGPLYADLLDGPGAAGSARRRAAGGRAGAGRRDLRLPAEPGRRRRHARTRCPPSPRPPRPSGPAASTRAR